MSMAKLLHFKKIATNVPEFSDKLRFYHTNRMAQVTLPHKSIVLRPSKLRIDDRKLRTEDWGPRTEDQELKTHD